MSSESSPLNPESPAQLSSKESELVEGLKALRSRMVAAGYDIWGPRPCPHQVEALYPFMAHKEPCSAADFTGGHCVCGLDDALSALRALFEEGERWRVIVARGCPACASRNRSMLEQNDAR